MLKAATALVGMALAMPAAAAEHVVRMMGASYSPAALTARVGDTIRFVNDDHENHNVYIPTVGFGTDFGALKPEAENLLRLMKAGSFDVECVPHASMQLRVTVLP